MKYLDDKPFSVSGGTQAYRDNYERIFRAPRPKPRPPLTPKTLPEPKDSE